MHESGKREESCGKWTLWGAAGICTVRGTYLLLSRLEVQKRVSEISYMCHSETDPESQFSHQLLPCHHHFLWCCPKSFQWPIEISLHLRFLQYYFKWHHQSPFPPGKHVRFSSGTTSQIFRTAPLVADDEYSGFLVGELGYFPDCARLWLAVGTSERWALREGTGIPGERGDIWRQKGSVTNFRSGGHCLEGKQPHRTRSAASQKYYHDKVKVSGCSSLAEEKGWVFLVLKFVQNLRSSDTSMHAFMQPDR